jgi:murein DD-endopeptidase MepM/ murein hydrolase activator NlpD
VSIYVMYAHLARDFVSLGDYVTPDDIIGVVGTTGYSEVFHLHMEVRYGTPGRFWNADFSQRDTLDRWLATMFANPALLVFPENHPAFVTALAEWIALQPRSREMP